MGACQGKDGAPATRRAKNGAPATEPVWPHYSRAANDTTLRITTPAEGGILPQRSIRQRACDWADAHRVSGPLVAVAPASDGFWTPAPGGPQPRPRGRSRTDAWVADVAVSRH